VIKFVQGDILKASVDALVNPVNCIGIMGKGLAHQFQKAFPHNYDLYSLACWKQEVQTGKMFITHNPEPTGPRLIVNFPTKRHWRRPSQLCWIVDGLQDLRNVIIGQSVDSIAIPPLGCGNGGLDWSAVWPEIVLALNDLETVDIRIYGTVLEVTACMMYRTPKLV